MFTIILQRQKKKSPDADHDYFLRWSFGGNRLQMKAEDKIMSDVSSLLDKVASIGSSSSGLFKSTKAKQDLVQILLDNERSRLRVWLFPLAQERKHYLSGHAGKNATEVSCTYGRPLVTVSKTQNRMLSPSCGWHGQKVLAWLSS